MPEQLIELAERLDEALAARFAELAETEASPREGEAAAVVALDS